jgi:hypothetical protein
MKLAKAAEIVANGIDPELLPPTTRALAPPSHQQPVVGQNAIRVRS